MANATIINIQDAHKDNVLENFAQVGTNRIMSRHSNRISKTDKITEAVKRMEMWRLHPETIAQFIDGMLLESEPPFGGCFLVEGARLRRIRKFEEKHNSIVYFVIHDYTEYGELENYLFVSDNVEEWQEDREDIEDHQAYVYVNNLTEPDWSEFGAIGVKLTPTAGLKRTW